MAREWYDSVTPTTGLLANYPDTLLPEYQFFDIFHDPDDSTTLIQFTESINISTITSGLVEVNHDIVIEGLPEGTIQSVSARPIRIFTGPSSTGDEFDILMVDDTFAGQTARECKVIPGSNRLIFSPAQITYHSITTVYITYYSDGSKVTARLLGEMVQAIRAAQQSAGITTTNNRNTISATAGSALYQGLVYVKNDIAYQFYNCADLDQCSSIGWIEEDYSIGDTVEVVLSGEVDNVSGVPLVQQKDLWAFTPISRLYYGYCHWDNSTYTSLTNSDFRVYLGKSYLSNKIQLNTNVPVQGIE